MRSKLIKSEHVQGWRESLYGETQCIMGIGQMGPVSVHHYVTLERTENITSHETMIEKVWISISILFPLK